MAADSYHQLVATRQPSLCHDLALYGAAKARCMAPIEESNGTSGGISVKRLWYHDIETLSALLRFVRGIHRSPVDSPHKEPVMLSFDVPFETQWRSCYVTVKWYTVEFPQTDTSLGMVLNTRWCVIKGKMTRFVWCMLETFVKIGAVKSSANFQYFSSIFLKYFRLIRNISMFLEIVLLHFPVKSKSMPKILYKKYILIRKYFSNAQSDTWRIMHMTD